MLPWLQHNTVAIFLQVLVQCKHSFVTTKGGVLVYIFIASSPDTLMLSVTMSDTCPYSPLTLVVNAVYRWMLNYNITKCIFIIIIIICLYIHM